MKHPGVTSIILFEDENLVIVNKPPFITSEQENEPGSQSLLDILKKYDSTIRLCHRLDKETSGAIIGAKNDATYREISMKFQNKEIQKNYHAIIEGEREYNDNEINLPISKQGSYKAFIDKRDGKKAITFVTTVEPFKHYTLIVAKPETGRFHQIRIHLASIGAPLMGDELYGGKPFFLSSVKHKYKTGKYADEQAVFSRAALHSYSVTFEYKEQELNVIAPYPKDFEAILKLLRKYDKLPTMAA